VLDTCLHSPEVLTPRV